MDMLKQWALALSGLLLAASALAQVTVSGVKFDDTTEVRGNKMQLNGAGIRYKAIFKVYAAGLYLPKKGGTTQEVLAMPGAKRLNITMLREIAFPITRSSTPVIRSQSIGYPAPAP
jgi:hypothetical protein